MPGQITAMGLALTDALLLIVILHSLKRILTERTFEISKKMGISSEDLKLYVPKLVIVENFVVVK